MLFGTAGHRGYEWRLLARNRLPHSESALDSLESPQGEPTSDLWQAELARALGTALEQLSPMCRAAVVLHRREQLTCSEVALQLGISVAMVKKHLAQGVAFCRQHLLERLGFAATQERD